MTFFEREFGMEDEDGQNRYEKECEIENLVINGFVRALKTLSDASLINNILDALNILFQLDELYDLHQQPD